MFEKIYTKTAWDFDTAPLKIEYINENDIHQKTLDKSDISVHLPLLQFLARQCEKVVEFGVRGGNSTAAILSGNPKSLLSVDINWHQADWIGDHPRWRFIQSSSTNPNLDIGWPDMLFIDSLHEYEHCLMELKMWNKRVGRWICLHDTVSCPGVLQAMNEFLAENPKWFLAYDLKINHGFSILQREYD
jgi:cephalosporin hydroxylase